MNMNLIVSVMLQAQGGGSTWSFALMMVLMFGIMYFFMIRPQMRKAKEEAKFINEVKKGDRVVTLGGIHGKIVDEDERTFLVEVDTNVRIRFERKAISAEATAGMRKAKGLA